MRMMTLRIGSLVIITLVVIIVSVMTFGTSAKNPAIKTKGSGANLVIPSQLGDTLGVERLRNLRAPGYLAKTEETNDPNFGHVVAYSDGNAGPYERTLWLQTWNGKLEDVQIYGSDKSWWLEQTAAKLIVVGKTKVQINSQIDGDLNGAQVKWYRLAWQQKDFEYRLVARNISLKELESIVSSIK